MAQTRIYFDYAAATPVSNKVFSAMQPYYTDRFYNPSALYYAAQDVKKDLDKARSTVAQTIGARPSEIIFTAGGTEANNLAIQGVMARYPKAKMVVSSIEHESVLRPAEQFEHTVVSVDASGRIMLDELEQSIDDSTVLVNIMYANNEIGTIQPIRQVVELVARLRQERKAAGNDLPLYLHTDACQAGNYLDLHVSRLGVDMMTLNGGKIYGPKQSGVLFVASHVELQPQILGGGQERGLRNGTENVAQDVGFAVALEQVQAKRKHRIETMQELQTYAITKLQETIPSMVVNGSLKHRLPNNIHITIPGQDNERLIYALDELGIMVAAGSACSASSEEASHVLRAIGVSEQDARASLRITMGNSTSKSEVDILVNALAESIA